MEKIDDRLALAELLLTAQIYNQDGSLGVDDLPSNIRKNYWDEKEKTVKRPIKVSEKDIVSIYGARDVRNTIKSLTFIEFEEFGAQLRITVFDLIVKWFIKQEGAIDAINRNPVLAKFYEGYDSLDVSYERAKKETKPKESDREWINSLVSSVSSEKDAEDMLKLVRIIAPEDVRERFDDIVLTREQHDEVEKIAKAIHYRDYLRRIGLLEIGKLLFVGPPGTGKTSTARALSGRLGLPFVEVRLSQIADQYLGETAKNIDRVFALAKKLSPCILFIDEFDFIAKSRSTDEHAALKRAVNTLLKAVDEISLVDDGVLLIGATNHPAILDHAVWRRFDEIVQFTLPDTGMRQKILDIALRNIEGKFDTGDIAAKTDGYSGSDLRLVVREAVLSSLIKDRMVPTQEDLLKAVAEFGKRGVLKTEK